MTDNLLKSYSIYVILIPLVLIGSTYSCNRPTPNIPAPIDTTVKLEMEEGKNQDSRLKWIQEIHQSAPGISWKTLEYKNAWEKHQKRNIQRIQRNKKESVAGGLLFGSWFERGSNNQAGSILATEFDVELNALFVIASGGSLFKGTLEGFWEVVNQDLNFDGEFLEIIKHENGKRMYAMIDKIIHFSDDFGATWNRSIGLETTDNWGQRYKLISVIQDEKIHLYQRVYYWDGDIAVAIYKSKDLGTSWTKLANLTSVDANGSKLINPINSDELFLLEKQSEVLKVYEIDFETNNFILRGESNLDLNRIRDIDAVKERGKLYWYTYDSNDILYESNNFGNNWAEIGKLPKSPWSVGLFISPSDPNQMLIGEVDAYRSSDRGKSWTKVNSWADYYADIENKLHADMMSFDEYIDQDGKPFVAIANHGGVSISYNGGRTNKNISLEGLNVSQYYSVRTDPIDPLVIYAGSQDQGFQRSINEDDVTVFDFDQVISGDYGHIIFTQGEHLWTVFPDGWVTYYENPRNEGILHSLQMEHSVNSAWIPPLIASPIFNENVSYLLGGSMTQENGSFIIRLEVTTNGIKYTELPFDFHAYTEEGYVSALGFSPFNTDIWYSATSNGFLFVSKDGGMTWEQSIINIPEPHYLYGAKIITSNIFEGHLYVAGSGYSGPAILFSDDGGQSFISSGEGLPPTTILDLAFNSDESLMFAATEAGPYVFNSKTKVWSEMSGVSAPSTRFWSVEYLMETDIVRFGTYGRGIFDFHLSSITSNTSVEQIDFELFPNPVSNFLNIKFASDESRPNLLRIYSTNGRLAKEININKDHMQVAVDNLSPGIYMVKLIGDSKNAFPTKTIVIQ